MSKTFTLQLDKSLDQARYASEQLDAFASSCSLPSVELMKMQQAMVEWLNNTIIYHPKDDSPITLKFEVREKHIKLEITDCHAPLPENLLAEPASTPDPFNLPEGGWGLMIIRNMSDRYRLESTAHGNTLHLEVDLPSEPDLSKLSPEASSNLKLKSKLNPKPNKPSQI